VGPDQVRLEAIASGLQGDGMRPLGIVGAGELVPSRHPRLASVAGLLRAREPNRVRDGIHALDLAVEPLRFAIALLALGEVDAVVAGPGIEPGRLAEAARWTLGPSPDGIPMGSASWIALSDDRLIACTDCYFDVPEDPGARARLALAASREAGRLSGERARVSFLAGPAQGDPLQGAAALAAFEALAPGIPALVDRRVALDGNDPRFRGRADVLIFPSSAAGHLAVRTLRVLAGARLLGPVLLGVPGVVAATNEDANDDELAGTAALAALLAGRTTS
jgi:phosphotransacetylase